MSARLAAAGKRLAAARAELAEAMEAARLAALAQLTAGAAEQAVARELGVDRMTVRKWAGKR